VIQGVQFPGLEPMSLQEELSEQSFYLLNLFLNRNLTAAT